MLIRRALVLCSLMLGAFTANAQNVDFTGTWIGTISGTSRCDDGSTRQTTGTATAFLLQRGDAVAGSVTLDLQGTCADTGAETDIVPVSGTISGSTVTGQYNPGNDHLTFSITVTGSSMSFFIVASGTTLSATLTRTNSQPPDSTLSGTYDGTFANVFIGCGRLPPVTYTGTFFFTLLQAGNAITGSGGGTGFKHDHANPDGSCTVTDEGPVTFLLVAQVNGNTLTGIIDPQDGKAAAFTATVSGATISGTIVGNNSVPGESLTFTVTRSSSGTPAPTITSFMGTPSTITAGGSAILSWSTTNATGVSIDNGIGIQPASGSAGISPKKSTTYVLTAMGLGGTSTATTTVTVTGTGPRVVAGTLPAGMLAATGDSAADTFTIANLGTDPANVSLTRSGNFFTITPASFTLQPGTSQSITIVAASQPPATYDGSVTINGDGVVAGGITVPVHLLVAAAPVGTVNPQPSVARVDVAAAAGQNPSGFVEFTNSGSAAMTGIAVADVPWIVPQSGTITINPGETKNVTFSIDRSRRADANSLFGGATGSLSLRFLGAAVSANAVIRGTTPASTVTVTIVDVVNPGVAPGAPPPLAPGELALFIAGHGTVAGVAGDLLLSNRTSSPLANLRLFFTQLSQFATLPQLASNLGVTLPSASNIFGTDSAGSMMLRGSVDALSATALRAVNVSGSAVYTSAIPVFRSDQGIGPGEQLTLSGVEHSADRLTEIVLQELSGTAANVVMQGYDANGAQLGTAVPISLSPFYAATDNVTVVDGTRSLVISNTSSGTSRINAYARVRSIGTADTWIVVDPLVASRSETTMIIPTVAGPGPAQTDIFVTGTKNNTVTATLTMVNASAKRRSVGTHTVGDPASNAAQQVTIQPFATSQTTVTPANGYIRLTGTPGSISASARVTMTTPGGKPFGSALPAAAISSAAGSGQLKRFAGVGDSSLRTIAAGTPATFRSSLLLIEAAGQDATVRVTVWYSLPAGSLLTAQAVSSKEFAVGANQMVVINDLARSVIGAQRDSFGDFRDMQVDVEVTAGSGKILSFIQSVDNGSRDLVIRPE